jgi:hypothetical protein
MAKKKFIDDVQLGQGEPEIRQNVGEIKPVEFGISEHDPIKAPVLGKDEDPVDLRCCSCLNSLSGNNSTPNFNILDYKGKTVLLCNDCNQKIEKFPQITPAFYVIRNDSGILHRIRFSDLPEEA